MTFEQALEELAIAPGASSDETRRAYLRLLKTRKPEVDPEGFRRLREAYEIARGAVRPGPPMVVVPPTPVEVQAVATPPEAEPAEIEAPEPAPPPAPPRVDATARVWLRIRERDFEGAARELIDALDEARASVAPCDPLVGVAMNVMLELHKAGDLALCLALGRSVERYLTESGRETAILREWAATKWAALRELQLLPPTFPEELRSAFAGAVLATKPSLAADTIFAFRRESPSRAKSAAKTLRASAPLLAGWYAAELSGTVGTAAPVRGGVPKGWGALAFVVIALLRFLTMLTPSSTPSPRPAPAPTYVPYVPTADERVEAIAKEMLRNVDRGDCDAARTFVDGLADATSHASATGVKRSKNAMAHLEVSCPLSPGDSGP